jgi:hypothetical protein
LGAEEEMGINKAKSCFLKLAVVGSCLLLVAAAAACGGSGNVTPSSTAGPSPASTVEPLPAIDPSVPLVEYRSPDLGYSVSYPEGWDLNAEAGSPVAYFSWSLNGRPIAQLAVLCNEGANQTVESLMQQDVDVLLLPQAGATMPTEPTPVELGGLPGKQVTYSTSFSGLTIEQVAAYAVNGDCGWRIGLATYGAGTLQSYLPLFDRIVASFRLD